MIPKLQTSKEKEAQEKKKKRLFTLIIVGVLMLSTAAFALLSFQRQEEEQAVKYKNFKFFKTERGWQTTVNGAQLITTWLPQDVENITSDKIDGSALRGKVYLVASSSAELQAAYELDSVLQARKQLACLPEHANESSCENLPLKSCEDASSEQTVIIFKELESKESEKSNKNERNETLTQQIQAKISYSDYCLSIEASKDELLKASNKVIFVLFGILS
jgi:hypothetical protein